MDLVRWVAVGCLAFFGGWAIAVNWTVPFQKGGGSLIPLCGGLLVALALAVAPSEELNSRWWLPLVLDLGCIPLFALAGGFLLWRAVWKYE